MKQAMSECEQGLSECCLFIRCKSVFVRGGFQNTGPGGYGEVFVLVGPRIPEWGALTDPESETHAPLASRALIRALAKSENDQRASPPYGFSSGLG